MSAKHDRTFFDTFMLVLGILFAVTLVLLGLARVISGRSFEAHKQVDPVYQRELLARIEPVAKVAVAGQDNSALEPRRPRERRPRPTSAANRSTARPACLPWRRDRGSTEVRR